MNQTLKEFLQRKKAIFQEELVLVTYSHHLRLRLEVGMSKMFVGQKP